MIRADLGPTNTGKTHRAITRMMQYRTGIIGLPLRLLAREVYDKLCTLVPKEELALVTGEERIIGAKTRYWVATVEAMPQDLRPEIVIIDEIQLSADPERGHVFTNRLLNARGSQETLFLGSLAMKSVILSLIPETTIETSERFSELRFIGRKKLSNLPPRSAVVAFSTDAVYATAEFLRRQYGGAAVVMGMLSPRTRNAQVELYQSGKVDYIVATDAIGMGLNLDIKHVFFAGTEKFDGFRHRSLFTHEFAQIAGRAGRYKDDGYFGTTALAEDFEAPLVEAIENHRFAPIKELEWRNSELDFGTLDHLLQSLEKSSSHPCLARTRETEDLKTLRQLSELEKIRALTIHPKDVELLWQVCQLPDFPKFATGEHLALVERIYLDLRSHSKRINPEYAERSINTLAQTHHNIEILARKLSQIRTWTYIAQRNDWLPDVRAWRDLTREVEDSLSDALHLALMQSFVDERTSRLRLRLKEKEGLMAEVNLAGDVTIEGNFVGRISGFRFEIDPKAEGFEAKTISTAAQEALQPVFHLRTEKLYQSADKDFSLTNQAQILWTDAIVGQLKKGSSPLEPKIEAITDPDFPSELKDKIERRLGHWFERRRDEQLAPLLAIRNDDTLTGLIRGVGFQIVEALGVVPREEIAKDVKALSQEERGLLRKHGVRFGQFTVFCPALLKPAPTELRLTLASIWAEEVVSITPPTPGLVTILWSEGFDSSKYSLCGYRLVGERAIRVDMLERLADILRDKDRLNGFENTPEMLSITGLTLEQFVNLMTHIGYRAEKGERPITHRNESSQSPADSSEETVAESDIGAVSTEPVIEVIANSEDETSAVEATTTEIFYTFKALPPKGNQSRPKFEKPAKKGKKHFGADAKSKPRPSFKEKPIDPNSPFAALMALKK